jgi:hypothetical protein
MNWPAPFNQKEPPLRPRQALDMNERGLNDPTSTCKPIPGTDGNDELQDDIMNCCYNSANYGPWVPFVNDCFTSLERCLSKFNLENPDGLAGRCGACPRIF